MSPGMFFFLLGFASSLLALLFGILKALAYVEKKFEVELVKVIRCLIIKIY